MCKVMESIICDEIYKHCVTNNLLSDTQHGFWKKKCTTSNLLDLNNDLTKLLDDGNNIDHITHFSKAFDKITHEKLLHKLLHFGIDSRVFNWIKDFLYERNFNVRISLCHSNLFNVTSFVP